MTNNTTQTDEADYGPVPLVAHESGIPKRTLYRWLEAGRLKSRTVDSQQVVSRAAVRTLAAIRDAGGDLGSAVPRAGAGAGTGTPVALSGPPGSAQADGQVAAGVFTAFASGKSPIEVVREMELPPKVVLDLHRQHEELLTAAGPRGPTANERIDELTARVGQLEAVVSRLELEVASLCTDVDTIGAYLRDLPMPPRSAYSCACGARGYVETYLRCTCCRKQMTWGFQPPKQ